jgi:hypothetical protein
MQQAQDNHGEVANHVHSSQDLPNQCVKDGDGKLTQQ